MRISIKGVAAAMSLAVMTACSDASGPGTGGTTFDPQRVRDGLAAVEQVGTNPVLRSFQALGGEIGGAQAAVGGADRFVAAVRQVAGIVRPEVGAQLIPIIRSSMLGKTFVHDPVTKQYVVAPNRTGAPANGVRFVLYQVDGENRPTSTEIGVADLIDDKAASATSAGLRLTVVSQGKTYLDYAFDLSGSIATAVVRVKGYMSDGTERVNFDITTTGQLFARGGQTTVTAKLDVPSQGFAVEAEVKGVAGSDQGNGDVSLRVTAGEDEVTITAKTTNGTVDATVKVNGTVFATIKGPQANPVIRGEGGRELTQEELAALGEAFAFAEGVFELFFGLLGPAGVLLLLGLGL